MYDPIFRVLLIRLGVRSKKSIILKAIQIFVDAADVWTLKFIYLRPTKWFFCKVS